MNISAAEAASTDQLLHSQRRTANLLAAAGGTVLLGAYIWIPKLLGHPSRRFLDGWDVKTYLPLSMMLIGLTVGSITVSRRGSDEIHLNSTRKDNGRFWILFLALAIMHVGIALRACLQESGSKIDTYTFAYDSCRNLLHGIDPFASGTTHANAYPKREAEFFYGSALTADGSVLVGYPYPPLALLWMIPGYLLGDIQYSGVIAVTISALLAFMLSPNVRGLWIVLALLLNPLTWVVEYQCWTEPLVLMTLSASVYGAVKKRWWLPLALGLFLATKQYNILAIPLIGLLVQPFRWITYWRLILVSLTTAVVTVLPFALWDFHGLWHDLFIYLLALPPRPDSISFAVRFPLLKVVGPVIVLGYIIWLVRTGQRSAAIFSAAYGLTLLLFFITSKQSFLNYFFLIAHTFFLAVAALPSNRRNLLHDPLGTAV